MEQEKKRDHIIYVTDIAISKICKSKVSLFSNQQNETVDLIHRELLTLSKNQNNSNETAIVFRIEGEFEKSIKYGTELSVNILDNPAAYAIIDSSPDNTLFLAHNHPSTQTFSYADIGVFLSNDSIGAL